MKRCWCHHSWVRTFHRSFLMTDCGIRRSIDAVTYKGAYQSTEECFTASVHCSLCCFWASLTCSRDVPTCTCRTRLESAGCSTTTTCSSWIHLNLHAGCCLELAHTTGLVETTNSKSWHTVSGPVETNLRSQHILSGLVETTNLQHPVLCVASLPVGPCSCNMSAGVALMRAAEACCYRDKQSYHSSLRICHTVGY